MTAQDWTESLSAKVEGTINLHESSFQDLDFLILLSSIDGIAGAPALSGYCASSTFLDAFAQNRAHHGHPVISIDVGMIAGEGIVAGLREYTIDEFLAVLNFAMTNSRASKPKNAQIICGGRRQVPDSFHGDRRYQDPKFLHVYKRTPDRHHGTRDGKEDVFDIQTALRTVKTPKTAKELTWRALRAKIAQLLVLPEQDLQPSRSVASYGMDSLVSVELQNWMSKLLSAQIPSLELMSSRSIAQLAEDVAKRSSLVPTHIFQT
jgi:acyl carrier protein